MCRAAENQRIVIAGSSYAGLHVVLRLATKLPDNPGVELTLVDRHDYPPDAHRAAPGRSGHARRDAVRIPPQRVMRERVRFVETELIGFDLAARARRQHRLRFKITAKALQSVLPHSFCIELPDLDHRSVQNYGKPNESPHFCRFSSTLLASSPLIPLPSPS